MTQRKDTEVRCSSVFAVNAYVQNFVVRCIDYPGHEDPHVAYLPSRRYISWSDGDAVYLPIEEMES